MASASPGVTQAKLPVLCPSAKALIFSASMSITEAEKKIKAFADGHKTGSFACVTPGEADAILREFYGLGTPGGTAVESGSPKILNLADFL